MSAEAAAKASTAVVVTTYNRPDALACVLEGYLDQDTDAFEVVIADDGSTDDTRAVVDEYAQRARFPIRHVWQEDRGFRAGAVRNRALAATNAEYVIFTDGDCVPSRYFVRAHLTLAEPGCFLAGNRMLLGERLTKSVLANRTAVHRWSAPRWIAAWVRRDVNRALPLVRLPDSALRKRNPSRWEGVQTCNLSAWRADLVRVNGFDERYIGWGLEDSDLVIRLLHAGVRCKSARFAAPVFHLWHREHDRAALPENGARLQEILSSSRVAALVGLDRYS